MKLSLQLPDRRSFFSVFLVAIFLTHMWAAGTLFYSLSGLILRLNTGELVAVISYILLSTLFESFSMVLGTYLLTLLPWMRTLREHFVAQASLILITLSVSVAFYHLLTPISEFLYPAWSGLFNLIGVSQGDEPAWIASEVFLFMVLLILILISGFITLILSGRTIRRNENLRQNLRSFADRVSILSSLFLILDVIAIVVVIIRNLT